MKQIDDLKAKTELMSRALRVIDDMSFPLSNSIMFHAPKDHTAAWIAMTLANLVTQVLYTLTRNNESQTRIYVTAVREALAREFYVESD